MQKLIDEFVQNKVDVIVVDSTVAAQVAKRTTSIIPIVMALVLDPVGTGLVASLASPGGNVTGLSMMAKELNAKRMELIKEALPPSSRMSSTVYPPWLLGLPPCGFVVWPNIISEKPTNSVGGLGELSG
jgi:putative ABC transport system substrate-binding protein